MNFISHDLKPKIEHLERKDLLTIVWANEAAALSDFDAEYGLEITPVAQAIVSRAIDDWNAVINSFNYAEDSDADPSNDLNDEFALNIVASDLGGVTRGEVAFADTTVNIDGSPTGSTVRLDDNAGGAGWFFDSTPLDDIEFSGIGDIFHATFVDVAPGTGSGPNDFYRTVVHEIGHALGITTNPSAALAGQLVQLENASGDDWVLGSSPIRRFTAGTGASAYEAIFAGGHLLDDQVGGLPATWFEEGGSGTPIPVVTHANDLMNRGGTVPPPGSNPIPTTRQFISDLDAMILADAYGYTITLPSDLDSAHTMLDSVTGQLLVQGMPGSDDVISITLQGANDETIRVVVDGHTEEVPRVDVTQILIAANGSGTVTVDSELESIRENIDYVVSSNEDNFTVGQIDLDAVVPGNQTTLRGAIIEANDAAGAEAIYLGRNHYDLTLAGAGGDTQGDFDITSDITLIGAGAGLSVIDASALGDRHFELFSSADTHLKLDGITLMGGSDTSGAGGGSIYVNANVGDALTLIDSVLVDNQTSNIGGALRVNFNSKATIKNSVFTDNSSANGGGAIFANGISTTGTPGTIVLENTIVANNSDSAPPVFGPDLQSGGGSLDDGLFVSYGNNLITNVDNSTFASSGLLSSDTVDDVEFVVTTAVDTTDPSDDAYALSLREAMLAANVFGSSEQRIWLPGWQHRLDDTTAGDMEVSRRKLTVRGVGPGLTVVDASELEDRIFEVLQHSSTQKGKLEVSRMTLTGGVADGGGAIKVNAGLGADALIVSEAAIINNSSENANGNGAGGAIQVNHASEALIERSVVANSESMSVGGGLFANANSTLGSATITLSQSIVANNNSVNNTSEDLYSQSAGANIGTFVSDGTNLFTTITGAHFSSTVTDHVGVADFVVTTVDDTFQHEDNQQSLSLREAVDLAHETTGVDAGGDPIYADAAPQIWMPAWDFLLSIGRNGSTPDSNREIGDLDIVRDGITIRGIGGANSTHVEWRPDILYDGGNTVDKVFDLIGDYTNNQSVGDEDFNRWRSESNGGGGLTADGNDDGVVDAADYTIWREYEDNVLELINIGPVV